MFLADGGGSGQTLPDYSGQQKLKVDPSAIPQARAAFEHALDQLNTELKNNPDLFVRQPWAEDPVSSETAQRFNQDTTDNALKALDGYRLQLEGVIEQLKGIENQYRMTEGDNAALWGKHHS
ncbi:hypothetical protein Lesp02_36900 [Lentzea sp. NBRC 105346]|uniref:transcriptional regulator n=1 Tax=Lentzea sp. NBRC 105346 TaxID=3032205 RepID=UPI0024A1710A|nr:transcriptional regulator [Lentzea sp. NBRC 105346]GLZ31502.1 hypothetical protein Lesp02_36900 [Lentzea sp. NBRC 105346]